MKFFAGPGDFKDGWNRFLERKNEHCETWVLRGDGETIFVEYTAKAHFLPGKHVAVLRNITRRKQAEAALRESEEQFQQMASNIQEIFWMLNAENMKVLYVSPAYEAITGRTCESLEENPKSYEEVIHPEDRIRVLSRLGESVESGQLDEEFCIVRPDNLTRWVWVRGFPVRDSAGFVRRLVGTAQNISARKSAEEEIARNLDRAESAGAEADAFRKTTLALTQNLSMDYVLDTLLQSLLKLVRCDSARILLVEARHPALPCTRGAGGRNKSSDPEISGNVGCKEQRVSDARSRWQEQPAHPEHCARDRVERFQGLFASTLVVVCAARRVARGARTSLARRYSRPGVYPGTFASCQIPRYSRSSCDSECPALRASGDLSCGTRTASGRFGAGTERASRSAAGQGTFLDRSSDADK